MRTSPGESLPALMESETELEAAYNFFNNPKVDAPSLLRPHMAATTERWLTLGGEDLVVIHDTSEMEYGGSRRRGLGPLAGSRRGFLAHVSLAASFGPHPMPLGVLALQLLTRPDKPSAQRPKRKRSPKRGARQSHASGRRPKYSLDLTKNENALWEHGIVEVERRLPQEAPRPLHVYDRGGDSYLQHAQNHEHQRRFVTRLTHNRALVHEPDGPSSLFEALANRPVLAERDIVISTRSSPHAPPDKQRKHPPRQERSAQVVITSTQVFVARPHGAPATLPKLVPLKLVHVFEPNPPQGTSAVDWVLATSEPIETAADIERVVDLYRLRWLIEEFFKALKSGCAVLAREFEQAAALQNVLALSIPLAIQMLALRAAARMSEEAPATTVLSEHQTALVVAAAEKLPRRQRPPPKPTARQALLAIAALGGHLKRNGEPGWLTLARGFHKLREMEANFAIFERLHSRGVKNSPGS